MNDPIYPRLRIRADANWRAVVRAVFDGLSPEEWSASRAATPPI